MNALSRRLAVSLLLGWLVLPAARAQDKAYYADYAFGTTPEVIDFGPVITAIPNAVVAETLRRDRILKQALGARTLRFHPLDKGPDAIKLMAEGKIDLSLQSDITMIEMATRMEVVCIGLYKQNFGVVVGPKGLSLASMKGKRFGTPGGGAGHFTLLQGLDQAGLGERDVTMVRMDVRDMPEALLAGRVDGFAAFEPAPSAVLGKHADRFAALYRHRAPGYLVVRRQTQSENPEAVRQIAAALARSVRWLRKDRANLQLASRWAVQAMSTFQGPRLSEKEIVRMTRSDLLDLREAPQMARPDAESDSLIARNFEFMKRAGKLPVNSDWNTVSRSFDFSVMAEVMADVRRYRIDEFDYEK